LNSPSFSSLERSLASNSASPASAASWRGLQGYDGAGGKAHGQLRGIRERRGTRSGNRSAGNAGRISGSADRDTHKTPVTSSSSSLSNMCARSRSEMLLDEELGSRRALPKSEGLEPCVGDSPAQTPSAVFLCDYGPDGGFFQVNAHLHAQPGSRFLIFPIRDGTPLAILLAGDDVMLASSSSDIQRLSKLREHPCISETLLDCRSCPPLHLPPPSRSSARPLPRAPRARPPPVASPRFALPRAPLRSVAAAPSPSGACDTSQPTGHTSLEGSRPFIAPCAALSTRRRPPRHESEP